MKTIDVDAKHLIRSYIDSIEEYFRSNSNLHPNEIDSLLNEINDFVNLRCRELAESDCVHYNDVLKAIDECGSPSEICDTYLDLDKTGSSEEFWKMLGFKQLPGMKEKDEPEKIEVKKPERSINKSHLNLELVLTYYAQRWPLMIYRAFSLVLIGIFYYFVFFYGIEQIYDGAIFESYYSQIRMIEWFGAIERTLNVLSLFTGLAILFVLSESFVIKPLKDKFKSVGDNNLEIDDIVLVRVFRFSLLLVILKSSILVVPTFIIFLPVWFFLQLIVERQFKTSFWEKKISPFLKYFGLKLSGSSNMVRHDKIGLLTWMKSNLSVLEFLYSIMFVFVIVIILFFPGNSKVSFLVNNSVETGHPLKDFYIAAVNLVNSSMVVISTFTILSLIINNTRFKRNLFVNRTGVGKRSVLILNRIVILQTYILGVTYQNYYFDTLLFIFLIIFFILNEFLLSQDSNSSFIRATISGFLFFLSGASENPKLEQERYDAEVLDETREQQNIEPVESRLSLMRRKYTPVVLVFLATSWRTVKKVFTILIPTSKSLLTTTGLFVISIYEVLLGYIILVTGLTEDGLFIIPVFELDLGFLINERSIYIVDFGPVYLWANYAIIMLGIQAFLLTLIGLLTTSLNKPEGMIIGLVRSLTRLYLIVILILTVRQFSIGNDYYAQFRLLYILSIGVFHELAAFKIRFDQKEMKKSFEAITREEIDSNRSTI
ncbi:MAG: hypothetical protein ACTSW1_11450 [Candidatus Hodarchaeales archaeon]